jgi:excisionase family DNA binding protein
VDAGEVFDELRRLVGEARPEDLPSFAGRTAEVQAIIGLRLRSVEVGSARSTTEPAVNISVEEAARRLGVSSSFIYKGKGTLPFLVKVGRRLVVSVSAMDRWQKARMGG